MNMWDSKNNIMAVDTIFLMCSIVQIHPNSGFLCISIYIYTYIIIIKCVELSTSVWLLKTQQVVSKEANLIWTYIWTIRVSKPNRAQMLQVKSPVANNSAIEICKKQVIKVYGWKGAHEPCQVEFSSRCSAAQEKRSFWGLWKIQV